MNITSESELDALYGEPVPTALTKEIEYISEDYARYIAASPLLILATSGPEGLDCSPRGDPAGFVRIHDPKTLIIPDRRGNNRVDSLRNIVRDPRVALLLLLPGIGETLRINGRAALSTNAELRESFAVRGKLPACVIVISDRGDGFARHASTLPGVPPRVDGGLRQSRGHVRRRCSRRVRRPPQAHLSERAR